MISFNSQYIKVVDNNSTNTIVYFSSVNVPAGKFNGTNAIGEIDANLIFVNCKDNSWYLSEIPNFSNDVRELGINLKKLTTQLNQGKSDSTTLYFGGSMGGYGALLYGCINNADKIIATGVELSLTKPNGYAATLSSFDFSAIELPDIPTITRNSYSEIDLIFGEGAPLDYADLDSLYNIQNVNIISVPNCAHKVPVVLENTLGISNLLAATLKGEKPLEKIEGKLSKHPLILRMLSGIIEFNPDTFIEILSKRINLDNSIKALMYERLGNFFKDTNIEKAQTYYKLATHFNPASSSAYSALAKLFITKQNPYQFRTNMEAAISLIKINKTESVEYQYYLLAEGLVNLGNSKEALSILELELSNIPEDTPLGKLILLLKEKIID